MDWKPIRKIIVGGVTSAVIYAARKTLHIDLGSEDVAQIVNLALPLAVAYAIRDPRVSHALAAVEHSPVVASVAKQVEDAVARRSASK